MNYGQIIWCFVAIIFLGILNLAIFQLTLLPFLCLIIAVFWLMILQHLMHMWLVVRLAAGFNDVLEEVNNFLGRSIKKEQLKKRNL